MSETQALGPDSQKYSGMLDPTDPCDQVTAAAALETPAQGLPVTCEKRDLHF